jgi:trehalose/maltose hydrolase-like predicted phosphorylase
MADFGSADPIDRGVLPVDDPSWTIAADGDGPASRFSLSNGFLGVASGRTYVAGLFEAPDDAPAVPELVPAPDWLTVRLKSGELTEELGPKHLTLDMRHGVLRGSGYSHGIAFNTLHFVSLAHRALGVQVVWLDCTAATGSLQLEASIGAPTPLLTAERIETELGVWRTRHSGKCLALATSATLHADDGQEIPCTRPNALTAAWTWTAEPPRGACFVRIVAFARGNRDDTDQAAEARHALREATTAGWRELLAAHAQAWAARWADSAIEIDGDPPAQRVMRFATFHLNGAANPADEQVSIAARGLTGEGYRGHVFWDTEIYQLPFFTFTWPDAARSLAMYRFHTLDAARAKAAAMGWRGALYAWESADTGEETTPDAVVTPDGRVIEVLCGKQEQHISADVAYAIWQYWQATGDDAFLYHAGAEILLEIARFWASRAELGEDGLHHISGVIGPDEYHETIDDNAYTNVMAQWTIRRGLEVAALLQLRQPVVWTQLTVRIGVTLSELEQWRITADTMVTGLDPRTGLFEQFAGYFALDDIERPVTDGTTSAEGSLGKQRLQASQLIKQADVVALLALLPDEFPVGITAANFSYYERRCCHESSLSPAFHGLVAARLGDAETAMRYFHQAAAIDLSDAIPKQDGGLHMATLGGMWILSVFGFLGVSLARDHLVVDPVLPGAWRRLTAPLQWRGRRFRITADQERRLVEVTLLSGAPARVAIGGSLHTLRSDSPLRVDWPAPTA